MNLVDLVIIVIAGAAIYRGYKRGLISQAMELGGGFIGLVLGIAIGPRIAAVFTDRPGVQGALISLVVVFVALSLGQTAGYFVGHRFGAVAYRANLAHVNSALGSAFGLGVTILAFWIVGSLLATGPSPALARAIQRSRVLRTVNDVLPEPPNVLGYIGQYLQTSGFPQVFVGLPRPIGPPVDLPSGRDERAAINRADQSTVRIEVSACGGTQLGSGWIAAPDVVVTNAHVVAGGGSVSVHDITGSRTGDVVLFDPGTDIAVVRAEGLSGRPLDLSTEPLERGAGGATLGYPGGGQLRARAAAVQNSYEARGLDIYGRRSVTRDVYELRSPVRQGDSGGPFVLPTGDVAGVVFAASTSDPDTGYALTGSEVADEVNQGINSTQAVGTGSCTH
jgi:S1-C subfamily serine protease